MPHPDESDQTPEAPALPATAIALIDQMQSEAATGEPDWPRIAAWARRVEAVASELSPAP